jgi:NAD(P)-dependent dehydrogenase (short-subunit alcohol dehydrogenase family)
MFAIYHGNQLPIQPHSRRLAGCQPRQMPYSYDMPSWIIVTGANRGIGLELVTQLLQRGHSVIATTRTGVIDKLHALHTLSATYIDKLQLQPCDMLSVQSIDDFCARNASMMIEGLINNAGVWGDHQSAANLDYAEAAMMYQVNALAPLQLSLGLRRQLATAKGKILHVTSGLSSIDDNQSGGHYGYRMSKAALNMMSKNLAMDLRSDGIASAVIEPGWVQTDMGGSNAPTTVFDSARGILQQYHLLNMALTGKFLSFRGGTMAW